MRTDQFRGGTPRKKSNAKARLRFALRNKVSDDMLNRVILGTCTNKELYSQPRLSKRTRFQMAEELSVAV